jgi:hypothetical protein
MRSFTITKAVRVFVLSSLLFFGVGLPQAMACEIVVPDGCVVICRCPADGGPGICIVVAGNCGR